MRRENHLKDSPYRTVDLNRESHLKHPAWSSAHVGNYRLAAAISASTKKTFWGRIIEKLFG